MKYINRVDKELVRKVVGGFLLQEWHSQILTVNKKADGFKVTYKIGEKYSSLMVGDFEMDFGTKHFGCPSLNARWQVAMAKKFGAISRDSLTANAFYVISGMNENNLLRKEDILTAYKNLDSKYGLKTFHPHFERGVKGVGRIVNLPKGTAENGATYIHATLFGILSLFKLDEGELAFKQLEKILPLTHEIISTTPFVMPNSYSYNEEAGMDGESMSDWYTGSANTLIKSLVRGLFGINPSLSGLNITPSTFFAANKAFTFIPDGY